MESEALLAWVSTTGLSADEIALVQPSYPPRCRDIRGRLLLRNDSQVGSNGLKASLELRWKRAVSWLGLSRWDLYLGPQFETKADANFAGLQQGLGKYRDDGWLIQELVTDC